MLVSKEALEKIRNVVEKNYNSLLITLLGKNAFSKEELQKLESLGVDTDKNDSLLQMIYYNYVLNDMKANDAPRNISEMQQQQMVKPVGQAHEVAEEHVDANFKHVVDKLKADVQSSIEGVIRDANLSYRNNALQNLNRPEEVDQLVKDSMVGQLKQTLRDLSGDVSRNFNRIAVTEVANALGMGSVDRVVIQNRDKHPEDIYVYRIPVVDAALCKFCRKFYLDEDGTPTLYRLSTLLNNGTNYGKKTDQWKAVAGATHPNDRESGILQLRPGWKVGPGGRAEYMGLEKWDAYVRDKLKS